MRRPGRTSLLLAACLALPAMALPAMARAQSLLGNAQDTQNASSPPPADQTAPIQTAPIAVPPPPPIVPSAPAAPAPVVVAPDAPPGLVETPVPPANADNGAPAADNGQAAPAPISAAPVPAAPAPAAPNTAGSMPPPMTNDWVPYKTARLGILDKVDGSTADVTIPVGGQSTVGDLLVDVLACVTRPPGEVPDDAVFVSIQPVVESNGGPIYRGWMVASIPGATVVGDASETFRVEGCS